MEIEPGQYESANAAEYGENYQAMSFPSPAEAGEAEAARAGLLAELAGRANFAALGSKIHSGPLSPGCRRCVEGSWSCLFINNICNGRCFYCPTSQLAKSSPATNNLSFPNPQDYLDYLAAFDFSGASISGGEPLLTFERTLDYVGRIKKRFGSAVHLWLYSNGILADAEKISRLREAGLDEMRFDISADGYRLDGVRLAAGRIPTVTVEIPAIPEDYELLRGLLPEMAEAGVNHLNLHQMRATPHNLPKLLARGYTFVHAPKVLVQGSEITALRLLRDALEMAAAPAINYCSFAYKSRFQGRAARHRAALKLVRPHEDITPAGYLRSLRLAGRADELDRLVAVLEESAGGKCWQRDGQERLLLSAAALSLLKWDQPVLQVSYLTPQLRGSVSYRGSHQEIALNRKRKIYAERYQALGPVEIPAADLNSFQQLLETNQLGAPAVTSAVLNRILGCERLPSGLFPLLVP
jgi:pyruvate formate-lyase activating enzyme-like uncharacterized protein